MQQLKENLQTVWKTQGFGEMTPIQTAAFDKISQGESVFIQAPTGSGKTLAYLLPLLNNIKANQTLQCLIFAPSQELVVQIHDVIEAWTRYQSITVQMLAGGANTKRQIERLKDKPEIIVATPGRFIEINQQSRKLKLHLIESVIFDEADYLFSSEHQKMMSTIISKFMRDVQKIWVSATFDDHFKEYLYKVQSQVEHLKIEETSNQVEHIIIPTPNRQKVDILRRLAHVGGMKAIIFCDQIHEIDTIEQKLLYHHIPVVSLHSQRDKFERKMAIQAFSEDKVTYLLTTDVASRGIDIDDIPYVIHFNMAANSENYTHRSGRTGRMNKSGTVISLMNDQEQRNFMQFMKDSMYTFTQKMVKNNQIIDDDLSKSEDNLSVNHKRNQKQKIHKKRKK